MTDQPDWHPDWWTEPEEGWSCFDYTDFYIFDGRKLHPFMLLNEDGVWDYLGLRPFKVETPENITTVKIIYLDGQTCTIESDIEEKRKRLSKEEFRWAGLQNASLEMRELVIDLAVECPGIFKDMKAFEKFHDALTQRYFNLWDTGGGELDMRRIVFDYRRGILPAELDDDFDDAFTFEHDRDDW